MPDLNLSNIKLPDMNGTDFSSREAIRQLRDYMFKLQEQLNFVLMNLDEENLSTTLTQKIESAGESSGVNAAAELDDMKSEIAQTAAAIELKVSKGDVISEINQSAEQIKIAAGKISLDGMVTANGGFKVYDGKTKRGNDTPPAGTMETVRGYVGAFVIAETGTIVPGNIPLSIGNMILMNQSIVGLTFLPNFKLTMSQLCMDSSGRWEVVTGNGTRPQIDLNDGNGLQYLYAKPPDYMQQGYYSTLPENSYSGS